MAPAPTNLRAFTSLHDATARTLAAAWPPAPTYAKVEPVDLKPSGGAALPAAGNSKFPIAPAGPFEGAIFDLDGTLLDTTGDLAEACNWAIEQLGYPPKDFAQWRKWAGSGHRLLMKYSMDTDDEDLIMRGVELKHEFDHKKKYSLTKPFDGIHSVLEDIQKRGIKLGILTNKPEEFVEEVVGTHFDVRMFHSMRGAGKQFPIKPAPDAAFHMAAQMGLRMERILYVGDTHIDMQLGNKAGMYTVGVTWGTKDEPILREHGAHAIVHEPSSLTELLETFGTVAC